MDLISVALGISCARRLDSEGADRVATLQILDILGFNWVHDQAATDCISAITLALTSDFKRNRMYARAALQQLADPRFVLPLLRSLPSAVPEAITETLDNCQEGWRESKHAHSTVARLIESLPHESASQQSYVRLSLQCIDPDWTNSSEAKESITYLVGLTLDPNAELRRNAEVLLYEIDPAWSRSAEARAKMGRCFELLGHPDEVVRSNAKHLLGRIDTDWRVSSAAEASVPTFIDLLQHDDFNTRRAAILALQEINVWRPPSTQSAGASALLLRLLDAEQVVRHAARDALRAIDSKWHDSTLAAGFVSQLVTCLDTPDVNLLMDVLNDIELIQPTWTSFTDVTKIVDRLLRRLIVADRDIRGIFETALDRIDHRWPRSAAARNVIRPAIELLVSPSAFEREWASRFLVKIDPEWPASAFGAECVPTLLKTLSNPNAEVRAAAFILLRAIDIVALDSSAGHAALASWILGISSEDSELRATAWKALQGGAPEWAHSTEAVRALPDLVVNALAGAPGVRESVGLALARIDPNWYIRVDAWTLVPPLLNRMANEQGGRVKIRQIFAVLDPEWLRVQHIQDIFVPELLHEYIWPAEREPFYQSHSWSFPSGHRVDKLDVRRTISQLMSVVREDWKLALLQPMCIRELEKIKCSRTEDSVKVYFGLFEEIGSIGDSAALLSLCDRVNAEGQQSLEFGNCIARAMCRILEREHKFLPTDMLLRMRDISMIRDGEPIITHGGMCFAGTAPAEEVGAVIRQMIGQELIRRNLGAALNADE